MTTENRKELTDAERKLIAAFIKRQEVSWSAIKELRDTIDQLQCTVESSLEEMEQLGMDAHLPTMDEMFGLFGKSPRELKEMDEAAFQRVRATLLGERISDTPADLPECGPESAHSGKQNTADKSELLPTQLDTQPAGCSLCPFPVSDKIHDINISPSHPFTPYPAEVANL